MCQVQTNVGQMGGHAQACNCGCCGCGCGPLRRHFITPAEEMERLENYRESLKNELTGVETRLKDLEACSKRIA